MLFIVREQIYKLIDNPVFWACVFSWFSAQFIKTVIKLLTGKIANMRELADVLIWRTGGMPSSHAALVTSVCTSIGFHSGVNSDIFILALCFTMVVIRDAVGVRRSSGLQAKALNEIGKQLACQKSVKFRPVKEVQGHKPLEVFVGSILGFSIATAFSVL